MVLQGLRPIVRHFELVAFSKNPETQKFQISVDIKMHQDLQIELSLKGPMGELIWPAVNPNPKFTDGLWESTCLEVFLAEREKPAYFEWNFSPSGDFAFYSFSDYRKPNRLNSSAIIPKLQWNSSNLDLRFGERELSLLGIDLSKVEANITAVLRHQKSGEKSYWALSHGGLGQTGNEEKVQPNFHSRENFRTFT